MNIRVGHGFDAHRFAEGDHVVLGGVRIPHTAGLTAHSDGDAVIHALCDALLGAAGWGDIGRHYPDTDATYAGIDSRELLRDVVQKLHEAGWRVSNVDCTAVAQAPRLGGHIPAMCECLAADLGVPVTAVNVKATTTEKMGFVGRGEGLSAHAVALICKD